MPTMTAMGVSVGLPPGWDGRIYRRPAPPPPAAPAGTAGTVGPGASAATTHAVTHAANFPLPDDAGDFGSAAVEIMGPDHVLLVLFEYHPDSSLTPLFESEGLPTSLAPERFSPSSLQRPLPGQAGAQVFFSASGRAFCLYVVLGSYQRRHHLVSLVNAVLPTLEIESS